MFKDLSLTLKKTNWPSVLVTTMVTAAIFYAGQYVPIITLVVVMRLFGRSQTDIENTFSSDSYGANFLGLLLIATMIIYLVIFVLRLIKQKPMLFLMLAKRPKVSHFGGAVVLYGWYFLAFLVTSVVLGALTAVDVNQVQELGIDRPGTTLGLILVFLSIVAIPAITEEILFRGFLYNKLKKSGGKYVAVVLTCLLFGLAHLEYGNFNWIAVADTLILSGFLIYISQKHKSLYSAMFLHAIKNSIAFYAVFVR